jgi:hypothetical protein
MSKRLDDLVNTPLVDEVDRVMFRNPVAGKAAAAATTATETLDDDDDDATGVAEVDITDDIPGLLRDHPHLKSSATAAAAGQEIPADTVLREHRRSPAYISFMKLDRPELVSEMEHYETTTPHGRLITWSDSKRESTTAAAPVSLLEKLKLRKVNLPIFHAAFESLLLQEAGKFYYRGRAFEFPPCKAGATCVGRVMLGIEGMPPGGVTFMALMTPAELNNFARDGRPPMGRRHCIPCTRVNIINTSQAVFGDQTFVVDGVIQSYRNAPSQFGEYYPQCLQFPKSGIWTGIIDPIATFRESDIVMRKCPINGRWMADQTKMMCTDFQRYMPEIGESMDNF